MKRWLIKDGHDRLGFCLTLSVDTGDFTVTLKETTKSTTTNEMF